jgi:hypothetical protein
VTLLELAAVIFSAGTGGSAIVLATSHAIRHVPVALANARLTTADAKLKEQEVRELEVRREHDWQEDTGRILKDQRSDIVRERDRAEQAQAAKHSCEEALKKLDAECKARDEVNAARSKSQAHEIKNVRAALGLVLASDAAKSIPPEAVQAAKALLRADEQKATADAGDQKKKEGGA